MAMSIRYVWWIYCFPFYFSYSILFCFISTAKDSAGLHIINDLTDSFQSNPVLDRIMNIPPSYTNSLISPSIQPFPEIANQINDISPNEYPSPDEDYDLDYTTSPLSSMDHVDITASSVLVAKPNKSEKSVTTRTNSTGANVGENGPTEYTTTNHIAGWTNASPDWWSLCQLPVFIVIFAVISVLTVTFVALLWLKSQMLESQKEKQRKRAVDNGTLQKLCPTSDDRWIFHTVINVKVGSDESASIDVLPQQLPEVVKPEEKSPVKRQRGRVVKNKRLLERRGSNVSLTIDLPHANDLINAALITPTRECSSEEFLLSAGNTMCRTQLRTCLKNTISLHKEFWEIPLNYPDWFGHWIYCHVKNRYQSILPNDRTRVHLQRRDQNDDGYINANYIRGYDGEEKAYIATQGPLDSTIEDFYEMIWADQCPIIVMMTHLVEKTKPKCEKYFPLELQETLVFGSYKVTLVEIVQRQGYVIRHLLVEYEYESRIVLHYWYDTWPDHKTPQNTEAILAMAREIEMTRTNLRQMKTQNNNEERICTGPVVVHCSAGIGRTGCFIAISLAIRQLLEENKVDLLGIVCQLRYDRGGMVQTAEQYEFVHRAVAMFESSLPDTTSSTSVESSNS